MKFESSSKIVAAVVAGQAVLILVLALSHWDAVRSVFSSETSSKEIAEMIREFTQGSEAEFLIRIEKNSGLPDPSVSPYPHCLATCLATVFDGEGFEREILLVLPGFVDRKLTDYQTIGPGSKVVATLVPFADAPALYQSIQRSDDISRFDLPLFFSSRILAITKSLEELNISELGLEVQLPVEEPKSDSLKSFSINAEAVKSRRAKAIQTIAEMRDTFEGGWEEWMVSAEEIRRRHFETSLTSGGISFVRGAFYYEPKVFLGYEKPAAMPDSARSIATLTALSEKLAERGTHLIAVPLPMRDEVAALHAYAEDRPPFGILSPERLRIIEFLLNSGVDVVDPLPWLIGLDAEDLPYYDAADHHLAPAGSAKIAEGIAAILKDYGVPMEEAQFSRRQRIFRMPDFAGKGSFPGDSVYSALTLTRSAASLPFESGLVVAGDCQITVPNQYHHLNANFHDHLCWEMGSRVGLVSFPGESSEVFRHLSSRRDDCSSARVLVFVFDSSFFTAPSQWWPEEFGDTGYGQSFDIAE